MAAQRHRTLVIWRHGQTAHNAGGIWQGQLDTELSETGRAQAAAAAAALAGLHPTLLWSSDLSRAAETARALASVMGLQVHYDTRLREIHAGQWQGLTAGDVAERWPDQVSALHAGQDVRRGVDGETVAQVTERVRACVDDLLQGLGEGQCAVVATHGITGRAAVASLVGMPHEVASRSLAGMGNCRWAVVGEFEHGWRVTHWNAGVGFGT